MKIAILGDGAMGCLFSAYLSRKNEVILVGHQQEKSDILSKALTIVEKEGESVFHVKATFDASSLGKMDLVILFVKSMISETVLEANKNLLGEHTYVLTFQNGCGHEEVISKFVHKDRIIIGTTQHNASVLSLGKVNHGGGGHSVIGLVAGDTSSLEPLAENFTSCGLETEASSEVKRAIWAKLCNNTSVSVMTAILQCPMEYLAQNAYAWALTESLARETLSVARADGYEFDQEDMIQGLHTLVKQARNGFTSISTDIHEGRKTEVDKISGFVVSEAKRLGVSVPQQAFVVDLVHALEGKARV